MSEAEIARLLQATVFVLGDLVVDEYVYGRVSRISPEAPVPVLHELKRKCVPGGAANVAANIAQFGAKAFVCGRVGKDNEAKILKDMLVNQGVGWLGLEDEFLPTSVKTRYLAGYQQLMRSDRESVKELTPKLAQQALAHFEVFAGGQGNKCLVISDYAKGVVTSALAAKIIAMANQFGVPVVTDPKSQNLAKYQGSTILKPNYSEACAAVKFDVLGGFGPAVESADHQPSNVPIAKTTLEELLRQANVASVVLSLSEKGVVSFQQGWATPYHIESEALEVADVSGAGDTMVAFLAMGSAVGFDLRLSTRIANTASGVVCGKLGTATLSSAELYSALQGVDGGKVLSHEGASYFVKKWQQSGKCVVFTNGCFDLLHAGHVDLLQKARALGDALIVGINSDASVTRLKGASRPIQNEFDRAAILAGLACVDGVVLFEQDTPLELICKLKPNVLVKGGDYAKGQVVGHDEIELWGGRVEIVPLLLGKSTTNIEAKIKNSAG